MRTYLYVRIRYTPITVFHYTVFNEEKPFAYLIFNRCLLSGVPRDPVLLSQVQIYIFFALTKAKKVFKC